MNDTLNLYEIYCYNCGVELTYDLVTFDYQLVDIVTKEVFHIGVNEICDTASKMKKSREEKI